MYPTPPLWTTRLESVSKPKVEGVKAPTHRNRLQSEDQNEEVHLSLIDRVRSDPRRL